LPARAKSIGHPTTWLATSTGADGFATSIIRRAGLFSSPRKRRKNHLILVSWRYQQTQTTRRGDR
jgi:hypothetical protein